MERLLLAAVAVLMLVGCGPSKSDLMAEVQALKIELEDKRQRAAECRERAIRSMLRGDEDDADEDKATATKLEGWVRDIEGEIDDRLQRIRGF